MYMSMDIWNINKSGFWKQRGFFFFLGMSFNDLEEVGFNNFFRGFRWGWCGCAFLLMSSLIYLLCRYDGRAIDPPPKFPPTMEEASEIVEKMSVVQAGLNGDQAMCLGMQIPSGERMSLLQIAIEVGRTLLWRDYFVAMQNSIQMCKILIGRAKR